jgi:hypothetical protein
MLETTVRKLKKKGLIRLTRDGRPEVVKGTIVLEDVFPCNARHHERSKATSSENTTIKLLPCTPKDIYETVAGTSLTPFRLAGDHGVPPRIDRRKGESKVEGVIIILGFHQVPDGR